MSDRKILTIPTVPAQVSRQQVRDMLAMVGMEDKDLVSFELDVMGVHAEVYARDEQGHLFTSDGKNAATHKLTIPIVEDEEPS